MLLHDIYCFNDLLLLSADNMSCVGYVLLYHNIVVCIFHVCLICTV